MDIARTKTSGRIIIDTSVCRLAMIVGAIEAEGN
jgi:hypothetical protein